MQATIKITMDNAAFTESPGEELARILKDLSGRTREADPTGTYILFDTNGNQVGVCKIN